MAKTTTPTVVHPFQTNFTAGELSPKLAGHIDFEKYKNGLETLENMITFPQGGVTRRSGTRFVTEVKDSSETTRLIPFEFSVTQSYVLEFGDLYIRFYKDNGQIVEADKTITAITKANPAVVTATSHGYSNGDHVWINTVAGMTEVNGRRYVVAGVTTHTFQLAGVNSTNYTTYGSGGDAQKVYEIATPYLEAQIFDLKFTQSADVMYIVHPAHEPEKLSRTAHTTWTLADVDFGDSGPYLGVNDPFDADHGDTIMTPQQAGTGTGKTITLNQVNGINGGVGWQDPEDIGRIVKFNTAGAARITSINSALQAVATITTAFPNADARTDWQLGAWSNSTSWPQTVSFFEQRLVFGGSTTYPQTIWASKSGDYENFDEGDASASDAFIYTIAANRVNLIRWLSPGRDLIVGTAGGEFKVGRPAGEPLKPDNVNITQQTTFGGYTTQPIQIGNAILFVQRQQRKIRQFLYRFADDAYEAPDMTLLAEHITDTGIVDVDWAQEPDSIYWAVRTDGTLLGMTYQREQDVVAWHKHIIGGKAANCTITVTDYANIQSGSKLTFTKKDDTTTIFTSTTGTAGTDEFKSETSNNATATNLKNTINTHANFTATVASNVVTITETIPESTGFLTVVSQDVVRLTKINESQAKVRAITSITEATENQVWVIVERIIGGATVQHVEYLDNTLNQDSALTGTVTGASTTVTNLDHLEGETVQILIDDAVYPKQIVTNGAITVSLPSTFASKTIKIGLGYNSKLKTLNVEAGASAGSVAQARKKRYNEVIVRFFETVGGTINGDQIPFRTSADEMGAPIPAFTGDKKVTNLGWDREGKITIEQTQPLPMTILGITGTIKTSG